MFFSKEKKSRAESIEAVEHYRIVFEQLQGIVRRLSELSLGESKVRRQLEECKTRQAELWEELGRVAFENEVGLREPRDLAPLEAEHRAAGERIKLLTEALSAGEREMEPLRQKEKNVRSTLDPIRRRIWEQIEADLTKQFPSDVRGLIVEVLAAMSGYRPNAGFYAAIDTLFRVPTSIEVAEVSEKLAERYGFAPMGDTHTAEQEAADSPIDDRDEGGIDG